MSKNITAANAAALSVVVDRKAARAIVTHEGAAADRKYDAYVTANNVTPDTVAAHVKALQALAFPMWVNKAESGEEMTDERKRLGMKFRNGLNRALGVYKRSTPKSTGALLTSEGKKIMAALIEAGDVDEILARIAAEIA